MIRNASKQPNIESKTFDINMSYTDIWPDIFEMIFKNKFDATTN